MSGTVHYLTVWGSICQPGALVTVAELTLKSEPCAGNSSSEDSLEQGNSDSWNCPLWGARSAPAIEEKLLPNSGTQTTVESLATWLSLISLQSVAILLIVGSRKWFSTKVFSSHTLLQWLPLPRQLNLHWQFSTVLCGPRQSHHLLLTKAELQMLTWRQDLAHFPQKNPKLLSPGLFCLNYCYDLKAFCCLTYSVRDLKYRHNTVFLWFLRKNIFISLFVF